MNSRVEVSSLDPKLVKVNSAGKVEASVFPESVTVKSLFTEEDVLDFSVGDIVLSSTDYSLKIENIGNDIYISSDYEPISVQKIWANGIYFSDFIALSSDSGFSIARSGNNIIFNPNALHTLSNLSGDIYLYSLGNLTLVKDVEQNALEISLATVDDSNIDDFSTLSVGDIQTSNGIILDSKIFPELTQINYTSGNTYLSGPTGIELIQADCRQLEAKKVQFDSTKILSSDQGLFFLNGSLILENEPHILNLECISTMNGSISFVNVEGDYYIAEVATGYNLLSESFTFSPEAFPVPFDKVLGFEEELSLFSSLDVLATGTSFKIQELLSNPSSLEGDSYTNFVSLVTGVSSNYYTLNQGSTLEEILVPSLEDPELGVLDELNEETLTLLLNLCLDKLSQIDIKKSLNRTKMPAYYISFDNSLLTVHLKSSEPVPPKCSFRFLLSTY